MPTDDLTNESDADPSVGPIGEDLLEAVADTLRASGYPAMGDVSKMGPLLVALSRAYNDPTPQGLATLGPASLPPRLAFSFARDVPKYSGAVRELVRTGLLSVEPDRPLRVLDVGAGLGASTFGVREALARKGQIGTIDATWFDVNRKAMELGAAVARRVSEGSSGVAMRLGLETGGVAAALGHGDANFDLVILGQVISELDRTTPEEDRVTKHVAWIRTMLERKVAPTGSLVIVEPALRDRTRHLHALRAQLLASASESESQSEKRVTVFAPCLHQGTCPMVANPDDWCHEDLDVDLPSVLVPLARAAGLRYQGLTFSYLVLRRDGVTLRSKLAATPTPLRMVSSPFVTKGKREGVFCGERPSASGAMEPGRTRVRLLDREERESNAVFARAGRGALLTFEPPLVTESERIRPEAKVSEAALSIDVGAPRR